MNNELKATLIYSLYIFTYRAMQFKKFEKSIFIIKKKNLKR